MASRNRRASKSYVKRIKTEYAPLRRELQSNDKFIVYNRFLSEIKKNPLYNLLDPETIKLYQEELKQELIERQVIDLNAKKLNDYVSKGKGYSIKSLVKVLESKNVTIASLSGARILNQKVRAVLEYHKSYRKGLMTYKQAYNALYSKLIESGLIEVFELYEEKIPYFTYPQVERIKQIIYQEDATAEDLIAYLNELAGTAA